MLLCICILARYSLSSWWVRGHKSQERNRIEFISNRPFEVVIRYCLLCAGKAWHLLVRCKSFSRRNLNRRVQKFTAVFFVLFLIILIRLEGLTWFYLTTASSFYFFFFSIDIYFFRSKFMFLILLLVLMIRLLCWLN